MGKIVYISTDEDIYSGKKKLKNIFKRDFSTRLSEAGIFDTSIVGLIFVVFDIRQQ